jgi:AhpD family alkylhydroperoxidase
VALVCALQASTSLGPAAHQNVWEIAMQEDRESAAAKLEKINKSEFERINFKAVVPAAYRAMLALESYIHECQLEESLLELVKMRVSQINGCAYCLDMHSKEARAAGETEQRLYVLSAWREAPFYSDRERAALAWTEAVTLLSGTHVPDEVYQFARKHFSEEELVNLTMVIVAINGWNRLEVSFRGVPGSYRAPVRAASVDQTLHQ